MQRVIGYIDGFNLYFGLKQAKWQRYYWLNLQQLLMNLLKGDQELVLTKYFTSRISYPIDKQKRQSTFIEALETLDNFRIFYGKYQVNPRTCAKCGFKEYIPSEKMTDVNIAVEMMTDAFQDNFDAAFLVSADSDLSGPVRSILTLFPEKRIIAAFPPQRFSIELKKQASACFQIGRANIAKSLFPFEVQKADGFILRCPVKWRPPEGESNE
jgi:uncharacterized LabA/DUF88 family protein